RSCLARDERCAIERRAWIGKCERRATGNLHDRIELPTTYQSIEPWPGVAEELLALTERQLVNRIEVEDVRLIVLSARVFKPRIIRIQLEFKTTLVGSGRSGQRL